MALDKKQEQIDELRETIRKTEIEIEKAKDEQSNLLVSMRVELEKVARMTKEEAKQKLMASMIDDAKIDAAKTVKEIEENAKNEGQKKAQDVIASVIQRCATDFTSEITVSTITLPNDEIKGRIIGEKVEI